MATITATVEPDATPPRVRITVLGASVTRTNTITGESVAVRGTINDDLQIYDNECPQGVPVTYTNDNDGETTAPVALPDCGNWLVHLSQPELSCLLEVEADTEVSMPSRVSSVRTYSGRPFSVAAGSRDAVSSSMTVHSITREDTEALLALFYDQSILFFSPHPGHDDEGPRYVRVLDVSKARFMQACESPRRILDLPYLISDRPASVETDAYGWDLMLTTWAGMPDTWAGMP